MYICSFGQVEEKSITCLNWITKMKCKNIENTLNAALTVIHTSGKLQNLASLPAVIKTCHQFLLKLSEL